MKHAKECAAHYFTYWVGQRGLIDTQRTRGILFDEMERVQKRDGAVPSAALLDVVIERLQAQGIVFEWRSAAAPVVPVELPPPVVLSDGSHQLALGTTPRTSHTVVQLRDLDRREREARNAAIRASNTEVAKAFAAAASTPALEMEVEV